MAGRIIESTNYERFKLFRFNRDVRKIKNLIQSMKEHGWIDAYPMHVVKENGELVIKGGHHRFVAAKTLGIPVKFMMCQDSATVQQLEQSTTHWVLGDFVGSSVREMNPHYVALDLYRRNTGIRLTSCASMMAGETAGSSNINNNLRNGTFKLAEDQSHDDTVAACVKSLAKNGVSFASNDWLVQALSRVMWVCSPSRLKSQIEKHYSLMKKQPNVKAYTENLEEIYNRGTSKKVPISFLQEQAAKERRKVWMKHSKSNGNGKRK